MKYVFSFTIFAGFVLALYFAFRFLIAYDRQYRINRLVSAICFGSAVWSLGFSAMILQTDPDMGYVCRTFGMIGVFVYLIAAQMLICDVSEIDRRWQYLLEGISFTGIPIFFLISQKEQVVYYPDAMGMTYYFLPGLGNTLYILYSVILSINMLGVSVYMFCSSKVKRFRVFGKTFLLVELIIVFGMILDTIFPMIGMPAIPGSTMTQFFGAVVVCYAVDAVNRAQVNVANMSQFIYYSLAMPVLVYDVGKKLRIMNDSAFSFFGREGETAGWNENGIGNLFEIDEEAAFGFEGEQKDIDTVCRSNRIYCSLAISKIHDVYGDVIGYIIIVTDLSERMNTIQRLEETIAEAESANRAKSIFLANMSHEIRTPMNAIIGFSELALKMKPEQKMKEYLEDIKMSSHNLLAIINDILDISKIESGKMELVCEDYHSVVLFKDVYVIISSQARKKGLEFKIKISQDIPNILNGDMIRIRGILINLLNNAVKYTEQGSVSLEIKSLEKKEDEVLLEFQVSDTGIGIRQEEQEKLFESFSRVDRKVHYGVEGSGLGLAIVKGYIEMMGGTISLNSVYGEGSVFTVTLSQKVVDGAPIEELYEEQKEMGDDFSMGSIRVSGVRVLVVDDNIVNLKVQSGSLSYYGLTVDTASGGKEAVAMCRRKHYPLIFMDQMMPEMDGIEAMREIREIDAYYAKGGTGKIIVLTANTISGIRAQLLDEGFDEYLGKPMNYKYLEKMLMRFLPAENIHVITEKERILISQEQTQNHLTELQELLPQVEVERGVLNSGGDEEGYLKIMQIIYKNGKRQLDEMETLFGQKDYAGYTIRIHALKGSAWNVGANGIAGEARELEKAGRNKDISYIEGHMKPFRETYESFLAQIGQALERYEMLDETALAEKERVFGRPELIKLLKDILECADAFDFAGAVSMIREAEASGMQKEEHELLSKAGQWMDEMETDKIRELLEKLESDD